MLVYGLIVGFVSTNEIPNRYFLVQITVIFLMHLRSRNILFLDFGPKAVGFTMV